MILVLTLTNSHNSNREVTAIAVSYLYKSSL